MMVLRNASLPGVFQVHLQVLKKDSLENSRLPFKLNKQSHGQMRRLEDHFQIGRAPWSHPGGRSSGLFSF
jgi:hypothetical protein